jgi:hypothetical protein
MVFINQFGIIFGVFVDAHESCIDFIVHGSNGLVGKFDTIYFIDWSGPILIGYLVI